MKEYKLITNVGSSRYVVNYYNGVKTYKDGSKFFDIAIFSNKVKANKFVRGLMVNGYNGNGLF